MILEIESGCLKRAAIFLFRKNILHYFVIFIDILYLCCYEPQQIIQTRI